MKSTLLIVLGTIVFSVFVVTAFAQAPQVIATVPAQNETSAPLDTDISAQFDMSMNETTINSGTFLISTGYFGYRSGSINYDDQTYTATFEPDDFVAGDIVTGLLTTGVRGLNGVPLDYSFSWSFTEEAVLGSGVFETSGTYSASGFLQNASAADLDGDGDLDLAASKSNTAQLAIFLNNGDGIYGSPSFYSIGDIPYWATAVDLDLDGDMDIATANGGSDNISILMNNGNGTFSSQVTYSTGDNPRCVMAGDFDGDGDMDLVSANTTSDSISFFRNFGNGTFAARVDYAVGDGPMSIYPADFDNDGDIDLATGHGPNNHAYVSVLLNNGDGSFGSYSLYGMVDFPAVIYAADLDNDGDMDIIGGGYAYGYVSVLPNLGNGTFGSYAAYPVDYGPWAVTAGDFNADDYMDIAVANSSSNTISVLTNDGDGTFTNDSLYAVGSFPKSIVVGDLDSDGDIDMAVVNNQSQSITILKNASLPPHIVSTSPGGNELNIPIDSDISIVFDTDIDPSTVNDSSFIVNGSLSGLHTGSIDYNSLTYMATMNPSSDFDNGEIVTVLLTTEIESSQGEPLDDSYSWSFTTDVEDGSGDFVYDSSYTVDINPFSVIAAELNGDGFNDLVVGAVYGLGVLLNNGDGSFADHITYPIGGSQPDYVTAADYDRDGNMDIASVNLSSSDLSVLINNGDGTFPSQTTYPISGYDNGGEGITSADLNGDGYIDIATTYYWEEIEPPYQSYWGVSVILNNGDGTFLPYTNYSSGQYPVGIRSADIDGDGDMDLVTANSWAATISALMNNGDGTFAANVDYAVGSGPRSVYVADLDADGDLDIAACNGSSNNVSTIFNNGDGTFGSPSNYAAGTNPYSIFSSDIDGDGDLDLEIANFMSSNASILINDGSGVFSVDSTIQTGSNPFTIFSSDLDGDGDCDLVTADYGPDVVSIYLNTDSPGSITGTVTDDGMNPLEGAVVSAMGTTVKDTTDVNGDYTLDSLESGVYDVSFASADYRDTVVTGVGVTAGGTTVLDVLMELLPGSVVGTVTDGLNPVEGVYVIALETAVDDSTDIIGDYALNDLEAGFYDISFSHIDYRDTIITGVEVTPGDTVVLDVTMEELPGLLSGTVIDSESQPIESVYVEINSVVTVIGESIGKGLKIVAKSGARDKSEAGLLLDVVDSVYTDSDGYYESVLPSGLYDVAFSHVDYDDTIVAGVAVTPGDTTILDIQLALSGCEYVTGDVNGSDSYNGLDITYGVNYLKGGSDPICPFGTCLIPPCDAFFYCGDVNGSCSYNGLDITYGVNYLKGGDAPIPCADCPPVGSVATFAPGTDMK